PPALAALLTVQVLRGLSAAHELKDERGARVDIVHRDVTPDNVLLGFSGVAKIVDFGVAKAAHHSSSTRTGQLKGKVAYMAPEQLHARPVDARTDIYATGVMLFELLASERPFSAPSEGALITSILFGEPRPLPLEVPAELGAIVRS